MGLVPEWIERLPDHPKAEVTEVKQNLLLVVRLELLKLLRPHGKKRKAIESVDLPDLDVGIEAPDYDGRKPSLPERVGPLEMVVGLHAQLFDRFFGIWESTFRPRFRESQSLRLLESMTQRERQVLADVLAQEFADYWLVRAPQHFKRHMTKWKPMTDFARMPEGILMGVHRRIAGTIAPISATLSSYDRPR